MNFRIIALVIFYELLSLPVHAASPDKYVANFPHVYEYDSSFNPRKNFWCGHAVLASTLKQLGKSTNIKKLHEEFSQNSSGYRKNTYCPEKFCAKVQDLMWATKKQYQLPYTQGNLSRTSANLLQKVKDAIKWNRGVIIPSNYLYEEIGHFWLIVGYKENPENIDHSILFMRDMARPSKGKHWDTEVLIGKFVYHTNLNGKIPYLIIKD